MLDVQRPDKSAVMNCGMIEKARCHGRLHWMMYYILVIVMSSWTWSFIRVDAFVMPPAGGPSSSTRGNNPRWLFDPKGRGGHDQYPPALPPPTGFQNQGTGDNDGYPSHLSLLDSSNDTWTGAWNNEDEISPIHRGGGRVKQKPGVWESTVSYWKGALGSMVSTVMTPFQAAGRRVGTVFQSKQKKMEEDLLETLRTMPVQRVVVPNTTVLPPDVVQIAARRSGVLGNPLRSDRVQEFANFLKRWYVRKGYVLHGVTGATLKPDTATAEISVQEPKIAHKPVGVTFLREMVIDPSTGELLTFRQYQEKQNRRRTLGFESKNTNNKNGDSSLVDRSALNTTFIETTGKTKPTRLAQALGLTPGNPFRWDDSRWAKIASSGLFSKILQAAPQPMQDGSVQFHIVAQEAPSRHLEYGVSKSLYTGGWEGEVDFEHANFMGGGETLGVNLRRGAKDSGPSVRFKYSDGRLGLVGGYDVEVFSEYIGDHHNPPITEPPKTQPSTEQPSEIHPSMKEDNEAPGPRADDYNHDMLIDRKGATFRVRNPIDPRTIRHSVASASVERTSTQHGFHETIGSTTMEVGPFLRELPLGARSNVDAAFTVGTRVTGKDSAVSNRTNSYFLSTNHPIVPFTTVTATTRQLFPLLGPATTPTSSSANPSSGRRPLILAFRHSVTASTSSIPRHVAKAVGMACSIRGTTPNGRVTSALRGTTELRVPLQLPHRLNTPQDATVVVYGDWVFATDSSSPFYRKSCVGLGLRKTLQGIPLQYDVTYSHEGKLKAVFGLGSDFVF